MKISHLLAGGLASLVLATSAQAHNEPGSLLVFPEFNNQHGMYQILTVTNTSAEESVVVEIVYIDGDTCQEFNRNIELTPLDTFSFLTKEHNPQHVQGYAYAFAKDGINGDPINFNHLVGSNLTLAVFPTYSTNPFVFKGMGAHGTVTELNGNGLRDLDNLEYSAAPDRLIVPRFMGQNHFSNSHLVLIGLTGGAQFKTTVDFLIYNDNEEIFSSEYTFGCWKKVRLTDITDLFSTDFLKNHTNHDLNELYGEPGVETGWFEFSGAVASSARVSLPDPSVLGFLQEGFVLTLSADLPFQEGERTNGSLLARSSDGTF